MLFSELVFRHCFPDGNFEEPQMKYHGNIKLHLWNKMLRDMSLTKLFTSLQSHDFQNGIGSEDLHWFQITKDVMDRLCY